MAVVDGIFTVNGIPRNGATAKLWSAGAFLTSPEKNDAVPSGTPVASGLTGPDNGKDGGYRFEGVTVGEYYVSFEWNGSVTYDYHARNINPTVSVMDFGATGDGSTDDTTSIQSACNAAAVSGGTVYFPPGIYIVSSPITLKWTASPDVGLPNTPLLGGIKGDGIRSEIRATACPTASGVIQILGESNTRAASAYLRDFYINMMSGCSSGSFGLRVGDCKDSFLAERIRIDGANGISLKVASSSSYAQMNTVFRQCAVRTNASARWMTEASGAFFYCIKPESGGAKMDNVRFELCTLNGYIETRAHQIEFDTCQFFVNPNRGVDSGGRDFGINIAVRIGNCRVSNSYFEDHSVAILITPGISDIDNVTIDGNHFSGQSNFAASSGTLGVHVVDSANALNSVTITNNRFGDGDYISGSIRINGGKSVVCDNNVNFDDPTTPIRILKVKPVWTVLDGFTTQPRITERFNFKGDIAASSATINLRAENQVNAVRVPILWDCWVSRVTVLLDDLNTSGVATVRLLKNGSAMVTAVYPTAYTVDQDTASEYGTRKNVSTSDSNSYAAGDYMTVQIITLDWLPINCPVQVIVELAR